MTNEQLAALAQDPDNAELVPVLWEKVKSLLYQKAGTVYNARKNRFQELRCSVKNRSLESWQNKESALIAARMRFKRFCYS